MSRETNLVKNTGILAVGTFLPKIASFITFPLLNGCLSKSEYGTYDLILVLVSLLLPALTLQIQTAAFRFLIDKKNDKTATKKIITNIYVFITPISIISLVILFFCLSRFDIMIRLSICLYFFVDMLVNATRQIVRGISQNMKYSISAIISSLGQLIFVALLVWKFKHGLLGGVFSLAAAETLSLVYLLISTKIIKFIDLKCISKQCIKDMLKYSWPMVPNSMSMWVMRMSDRLVVIAVMGVTANAVYSVANKIPQLLSVAQNTFTMAWQENASIVSKDKDASGYYTKMFNLMFDIMAGFLGIIIAATPILFIILVKGDYDEAYVQIPILLVSMFFFSMAAFLGGIYVAYMATKSVGITTIAAAAINLIVDIALIHFIGLYAASISTLVSYILLFFFRLTDVKKYVKIKYNVKHMILVFAVMIIECSLCMIRNIWLDLLNILIASAFFLLNNREFIKIIMKKIFKKSTLTRSEKYTTVYKNADKKSEKISRLPELYNKKDDCCGCTACFSACPVGAIEMAPDKEGFLYPEVNVAKCISCYKCEKVCAFKSYQKEINLS